MHPFNPRLRPLTSQDQDVLSQIVKSYGFSAYRNYRSFTSEAQAASIQADVLDAVSDLKNPAYVSGEGQNLAAAVARHLSWDSEFFGVGMARLDYVFGSAPSERETVLKSTLESLRASGVRHVSARVDAADHATTVLLQEHSFRYMGALLTHVARPGKDEPKEVKAVGNIRLFEPGMGEELVQLATDAFAGTASRFHIDPHLPQDRSQEFYTEWARACVSGKMADTIIIAEDAGRLIGFLAFRTVNPISRTSGTPIFGGGLGACRPGSGGAYAGLIRAGVLWAHKSGAIAEVQTPADNTAAIHIFEAVGFSHRRTDYLFHLWLP
jgi:RimJ/RimL family protein N-acetyltransferase